MLQLPLHLHEAPLVELRHSEDRSCSMSGVFNQIIQSFSAPGPEIANVGCQNWVRPKLSGERSDTNTHYHINTPKYFYRCTVHSVDYLITHTNTHTHTHTHIYIYIYILTPWCRVLLEKLTRLQLVKKFPTFHRTRRFITALTSVRHLSVSWASSIQPIYPHPNSWRSIIILSTHLRLGLPSGLFPSGFPTKTLYTHLSSPICATCPAHLILLDFITCYLIV